MSFRTAQRFARSLEPDGFGRLDRLAWYVEKFRAYTPDQRVLANTLEVVSDTPPRITGLVSLRQQQSGLKRLLKHLRLNEVQVDLQVLERQREPRFLIARQSGLLVYAQPTGKSAETQLLLGEPARRFAVQHEGRYLVQSSTGYLGWATLDGLEEVSIADWVAALPPIPHRLAQTALQTAHQLLDLPYLWGGLGIGGVDCSGLVFLAWAQSGVFLPRDSDQQFLCGKVVATPHCWEGLGPGDLLFFAGDLGRITHVALHIENGRFIEATHPVVRVASLNPTDPLFVSHLARSFVYGKRVVFLKE